jgi:hypothetical protein
MDDYDFDIVDSYVRASGFKSDIVEKLIETNGLGTPQEEFKTYQKYPFLRLLFGFFCLVMGMWQLNLQIFKAGYYFLKTVFKTQWSRVLVCEHGLLLKSNGVWFPCRWEEILAVVESPVEEEEDRVWGTITETYWEITLHLQNGHFLIIKNHLEGLAELATLVEMQTLCHLLPAAQEKFDAWEPLAFGPLEIGHDGITYQEEFLAWDQLEGMQEKNRLLFINQRNTPEPWHIIPRTEIPNVHVLLAFVAQHLQEEFPQDEAIDGMGREKGGPAGWHGRNRGIENNHLA